MILKRGTLKNNLKKALALISFTTLIVLFLLYQTGTFNSYLVPIEHSVQTSPNGGKIPIQADSTKPERFSSSKSIIVTDKNPTRSRSSQSGSVLDSKERMSSSKSLVLIDNDPISIERRKREYLAYAIRYRSMLFQDSLGKTSMPLPPWFYNKLDSITFKRINWFRIR
jgi:hypothetical protein